MKCFILNLRGNWVICDFPSTDYINQVELYIGDTHIDYISEMLLSRFEKGEVTNLERKEKYLWIVSTIFSNLELRLVSVEKVIDFRSPAEAEYYNFDL
jgi:hypothetical protein